MIERFFGRIDDHQPGLSLKRAEGTGDAQQVAEHRDADLSAAERDGPVDETGA
ncbi:hypothetical protein SDC9_198041 [bioreactor metagenome]|uniref:Uncharacterized protein n=1 Tax=bioreactor metagenome TaxID=1076179 RepID=A0A645IGK5_9ZZZZ